MMAIRHGPGVEGTRIISSNTARGGYTVERGYHTPYDNFTDNVDADRMALGCRLVTSAVYSLAMNAYDEFTLSTNGYPVKSGVEFAVESKFNEAADSNVAMIYYDFNPDKFEFVSFTPAAGVTLVGEPVANGGEVQVTVMKPDYALENVGSLTLRVKDGVENGIEEVRATVRYVVDVEGVKTENLTGDVIPVVVNNHPDTFTLINLSDIIDYYGADSLDENWLTTYVFWDFNGNGMIEISDVTYVAQRVQ